MGESRLIHVGGRGRTGKEKQKEKSRPSWACKGSALELEMASMENRIFLHLGDGFGANRGQRT